MDIVSHDVRKFFGLLLKKNGLTQGSASLALGYYLSGFPPSSAFI